MPADAVQYTGPKRACKHSLYKTWKNMRSRCYKKSNPGYTNYGGRGITVYTAWLTDFKAFAAYIDTILGVKPSGHSLDRIDNDGNYEPGNLRWASRIQQVHNRRLKAPPKSGYHCITERGGKWRLDIQRNSCRYRETFSHLEDAIRTYEEIICQNPIS